MKRFGILIIAAVGLLALPGSASANHSTTASNCPGGAAGPVVVYGPASSAPGYTSTAGVCVYVAGGVNWGGGTFYGGLVEVGLSPAGAGCNNGSYGVIDGHDNNTDPGSNQSSGYGGFNLADVGPACDSSHDTTCNGSDDAAFSVNSGDCFYLKPTSTGVNGVPLICGNTSGNAWDDSKRDGCSVP